VKVAVIVQARLGSTRLPGKVLLPLAGKPLLQRMLERVAAASTPFELVVATTTENQDQPIRDLCRDMGVRCFSGHPLDLLDRHYRAARECQADVVVKVPSDCPMIDPGVIDRVLGYYLAQPAEYDFVSNLHPASYPDGNDVEVIPFSVLASAWGEAMRPLEREHTTPFIWDQPGRFRIGNVRWETGLDFSATHRWTIDYQEDYALLAWVFEELWSEARPVFRITEIINLLAAKPEIAETNARYAGMTWTSLRAGELRTGGRMPSGGVA
jgi:spore coat polysaccharide biosynthesis protein SpsF